MGYGLSVESQTGHWQGRVVNKPSGKDFRKIAAEYWGADQFPTTLNITEPKNIMRYQQNHPQHIHKRVLPVTHQTINTSREKESLHRGYSSQMQRYNEYRLNHRPIIPPNLHRLSMIGRNFPPQ